MSDHSADTVRLLISKGANVKATDVIRTTSLRAAVLGNDIETIRLLVDAGVDVNAPDIAGIYAFDDRLAWVARETSKPQSCF